MPGNLGDIFPLRFRLREELRFFPYGDSVIAEKVRTGQRYSLKRWQYELLLRFDGKTTFEQAARAEHKVRPGRFTALGLLNFYNWLYTENLVLCECESIFELVLGESSEPRQGNATYRADEPGPREPGLLSSMMRNPRARKIALGSAAVLLVLSILRIAFVAAPVLEPPVQRLYTEAKRIAADPEADAPAIVSERGPSSPAVERVSLASRIDEIPDVPEMTAPVEPAPPVHDAGEPPLSQPSPEPRAANVSISPAIERIEELRIQLEECRVRRDEFYLQNDEEGYRREVHRMTNLAREIGDIEETL